MKPFRFLQVQQWAPSDEDIRLMIEARTISVSSTDKSERTPGVGAVIVSRGMVLTAGYNGFVRGIKDLPERHIRPEKYMWTIHAEARAIAQMASTMGGGWLKSIYVTKTPCTTCMQLIIESGLSHVFCAPPDSGVAEWDEEGKRAIKLAEEAKVIVRIMPRELWES